MATKPMILVPPIYTILDNSGRIAPGAKIWTYVAGTTNTHLTSYTDSTLGTPNANPIVADSYGRISGPYTIQAAKLVCCPASETSDPPSTTYWSIDNYTSMGQLVSTVTKTGSTYAVLTSDRDKLIIADATSNNIAISLPSASSAGDGFNIKVKKSDSSSHTVTITPNGTDLLDGANSAITLSTQNDYFEAYSNGTSWYIPKPNTFTNLGLSGNLTVGGTLAVTGTSTFTGAITANGTNNLQPNNSVFFATTSGHSGVVGNGVATYTIIYETCSLNVGTNYNTSTGIYTAPVTGWYLFTANISVDSLASDNTYGGYSFNINGTPKNIYLGSPYAASASTVSAGSLGITGSLMVKLTASDTVKVVIDIRGHATNNVAVSGNSYFSGRFLG